MAHPHSDGPKTKVGRPSIRAMHKAATSESLLTAAWELYLEQGYHPTTIEQIAERAGASRATFYLHFDKKVSTVVALFETRLVPEMLAYSDRLEALGQPTRTQLREWLGSALDFYTRYRRELEVIAAAGASEPELAEVAHRMNEQAADRLTTFVDANGPEGRAEARTRIVMLAVQLNALATLLLNGRLDIDRETALDILLDFWSTGLRLRLDTA